MKHNIGNKIYVDVEKSGTPVLATIKDATYEDDRLKYTAELEDGRTVSWFDDEVQETPTEPPPTFDNFPRGIRTFKLVRDEDVTGISGTGVIAEGVEFSNGTCVLSWLTTMSSIGMYPNVKEMERIHGHGGRTRVVFNN